MIVAELVVVQGISGPTPQTKHPGEVTEHRVPCSHATSVHAEPSGFHSFPVSVFFQQHLLSPARLHEAGVRTSVVPLAVAAKWDSKQEAPSSLSGPQPLLRQPPRAAHATANADRTQGSEPDSEPHGPEVVVQPALFYPTTDEQPPATDDAHALTTSTTTLLSAADPLVADPLMTGDKDHEATDEHVGTRETTDAPHTSEHAETETADCRPGSTPGNTPAESASLDGTDRSFCIIRPTVVSVPTVSIVMTTYNCAKYIEFAVRSMQLQTLTNWELIVVDDRSTDNTDSLLRSMAQHDDRIVYLNNQHNLGCYASKNIGIQHARGTWLTFQDADDYSMSERLEKQLAFCCLGTQNGDVPPPHQTTQPKRSGIAHDCCYVMSLSRKQKVWSWVPITMFVHTATFRTQLGAFDTVRFGADSEIRDRMRLLGMRVGVFRDYLYSCPDRWLELSARDRSLTGNAKHDPIRIKYKASFTNFHRKAAQVPLSTRTRILRYTFDAQACQEHRRPFVVPGLTDTDKKLFYPSTEDLRQTLETNAQSLAAEATC